MPRAYGHYSVMNTMAANGQNTPARHAAARGAGCRGGEFLLGLMLIFIGAVVLLDRADIGRSHLPEQLWPFVVILVGVAQLAVSPTDESHRRSRRPGIGWLIVGCWGALNELHVLGFDYDTSWPLLIVAAGAMMVWRALDPVGVAPVAPRE